MSEYHVVKEGKVARVELHERLTALDVPSLQPALKKAIVDGAREVVFDLGRTVSLDSTGIGLLIATNNSLASSQGSVRLINVSPDILRLLRSMRLVERLHATPAEEKVAHVQ